MHKTKQSSFWNSQKRKLPTMKQKLQNDGAAEGSLARRVRELVPASEWNTINKLLSHCIRKEKNKGSFLNHKICFLFFWYLKFHKQLGFLWKRTYQKYTFCWLKRPKFSRKIPFISSKLIKKRMKYGHKFPFI